MLLLALDTSNRRASIALCSEDDVYGEYTWFIDSNHSVELLTRIQRLVAECRSSYVTNRRYRCSHWTGFVQWSTSSTFHRENTGFRASKAAFR